MLILLVELPQVDAFFCTKNFLLFGKNYYLNLYTKYHSAVCISYETSLTFLFSMIATFKLGKWFKNWQAAIWAKMKKAKNAFANSGKKSFPWNATNYEGLGKS